MSWRTSLRTVTIVAALCIAPSAIAGWDEGVAAYQAGDFATAVKEIRPLAEQGHVDAQAVLGAMYKTGQGVPKDEREAVRWFRMAAEQGNAPAQVIVGGLYTNSKGMPQDLKEAVKWFRMAAEQGNAMAQFNLGTSYHNGHGVPQSDREAVKWFRMAADQGDADAQGSLGLMYAQGQGVLRLNVVAYALFNLVAMDTTSDYAKHNRELAAKKMTAAQIEAGQALSREMMKPGNFGAALDRYLGRQ